MMAFRWVEAKVARKAGLLVALKSFWSVPM